jgi:fumarate reductase subunit D
MWWSLFSAGGVVSAFLMPVTLLITAIAVPAGLIDIEGFRALVQHPLARVYLLVIISLSMFHWAHRFRHTVSEPSEKGMTTLGTILCYGGAIVVSVLAVVFVLIRAW